MKLKKIFTLLFITLGILYTFLWENTKEIPSLKEIHTNLYDLCLPDDVSLTVMQRIKRVVYREVIWHKIKSNKALMAMLEPIKDLKNHLPTNIREEFDDVVSQGFFNVSPDRQDAFRRAVLKNADPDLRMNLVKLHKTWLYIIYSMPLTHEIADIPEKPKTRVHDIRLNLPPSKLKIQGSEIVHEEGEIDYLIIGSGPAGSVIAHELAKHKDGARVVLLESGSFVKPLSTLTELASDLIESENKRHDSMSGIIIRNGATVGGGTTVNLDLAFSPLLPQIKEKLKSWVEDKRLPNHFFHQSGSDWYKLEAAYQWVTAHVLTRTVSENEINKNNQLLKDGSPQARTYDLNSRKPLGDPSEILKISATEAFIVPALKGGRSYKGHLSLISDAKVKVIDWQNNQGRIQATGVRFTFQAPLNRPYVEQDHNHLTPIQGKEYILRAKNIIVSAGTLGSAEILLRSKIPNDNIGKGVILHPSMGIIGRFDREISVHEGLSASVYAPAADGGYFFEAMKAEPGFVALLHPGNGGEIIRTLQNYKKLGGFGIMLIDSVNSENRVVIDPNKDKTEVIYQLSSEDKNRFKEAIKSAVSILFQQGAREVLIPTTENIFEEGQGAYFTSIHQAEQAINKLDLLPFLNFGAVPDN